MDLSCRPWSINTYALSKVWFKCYTGDIRAMDSSSISSKVRSWLFQDQLEKPQEMILYRPIQMGGLGLHNVKFKALASLIRTFLETSVHPSFQHSQLHTILYRVYVLGDDSLPTAHWYRYLVEEELTMTLLEDNTLGYIKSRAELSVPTNDWETTWRRARLKGLGSAATSFLWKLVHKLLPTEDRLARILPSSEPGCKLCPNPAPADLVHCLFRCVSTREMGSKLISFISTHDPLITPR